MATSARNPGTAASVDTGTDLWGSPTNGRTNNGVYTSSAENSGTTSDVLRMTNFGFTASIPAGSTINGITVDYERKTSGVGTAIVETNVQLVLDGVNIGTAKTSAVDWATSDEVITLGGASDVWGATLDHATVTDTDFGVDLWITWASSIPAGGTADVDYFLMTVDYTEAPASGGKAGRAILMCEL